MRYAPRLWWFGLEWLLLVIREVREHGAADWPADGPQPAPAPAYAYVPVRPRRR